MRNDITPAMETAVSAVSLKPIFLCELDFASGTVFAWSGSGNLTWNGNLFLGVGNFGGISQAPETTDIRATNVDISLSGIPSGLISLVLADDYQGRAANIWLGLLDSSNNVIGNPLLIFGGNMDTAKIDDSGTTSTITITAENTLVDLDNPRERRFTDQDQQNQYPGDLGLQYIAKMQNMTVNWGLPNTPANALPGANGTPVNANP